MMVSRFYEWASAQPLFIQIPIGLAIFLVGIYALGWIMGVLFLSALRWKDRKKSSDSNEGKS